MLDHLDDLASDFSAIHGIRDMLSLPGPVFLALAERMYLYQGVIAVRVAEQEAESPPSPHAQPEGRAAPPGDRVTPRAVLQNDAAFAGVFSFSEARTA